MPQRFRLTKATTFPGLNTNHREKPREGTLGLDGSTVRLNRRTPDDNIKFAQRLKTPARSQQFEMLYGRTGCAAYVAFAWSRDPDWSSIFKIVPSVTKVKLHPALRSLLPKSTAQGSNFASSYHHFLGSFLKEVVSV
jgi:hypothetical protein